MDKIKAEAEARRYIDKIKAPLKKEFAEAVNEWHIAGCSYPRPLFLHPCEGIDLAKMKGSTDGKPTGLSALQAMFHSKHKLCFFYLLRGEDGNIYCRASRLRVHDEEKVIGDLETIWKGENHVRDEAL